MKNAIKASEIIRNSWDWHGKKTQEFIINGKKIKTNLCAEWSYYDGMGAPEKYSHVMGGTYFNTNKPSGETLDDLIAEGYDEIRFMLYASKMIRGYCDVYVFACNSSKAKEKRAQLRAEAEAKKIEEAKAELQRNLSAQLKADAEKKAEREAQAQAEAIQRGAIINPEKKYSVVRYNKNTGKEESMGIWLGDGMQNFKKGSGFLAGLFYTEDSDWLYYAQEEPEKEIAQADAEESTESNLEAQMSMLEIANINNLTEFYNSETDSIRFPDEYFENTEIFVFRMMRENPDLIMSTAYDFQNARWIHLEMRAQPEKAQEEPQSSDDEITQETSADATESNSEPLNDYEQAREEEFQRELAKLKKRREKAISREMIDAYNRLAEALNGREYYYLLRMYHEFKDVSGKFKSLNHGLIRDHYLEHEGEIFFIKKIKNASWLYWEYRGECERWLLNDLSRAYFIREEA